MPIKDHYKEEYFEYIHYLDMCCQLQTGENVLYFGCSDESLLGTPFILLPGTRKIPKFTNVKKRVTCPICIKYLEEIQDEDFIGS